jgi:class 3 adenylate cyclase
VTNVAARLTSSARDGQIVVDEETYRRSRSPSRCEAGRARAEGQRLSRRGLLDTPVTDRSSNSG